jgi:predicted DNA-binding protein (UPF0251 family)/predicted Fe-Mo cluster-binding NifX family protein
MPREKSQRNLHFKPTVTEYTPANSEINGVCNLLHEEIEAIYLMDVMNLYQEDAAKKMGVSRPTFTRILKSARNKLANAIVSGYKIVFEDSKKDEFIIAICSSDEKTLDNIDPKQEFIHIYKVNTQEILLLDVIVNPSFLETKKPAIVLPSIFLQNNVNIFISSKIGEGLKNSLISKGIRPIIKETLSKDELLKLF